jgi:hypothetical protein
MSGKQKALLILLAVALVVLFVVAVGVSSGRENGDPNQRNGFVEWLANFGAKNSAVDPATVTADCPAVDGQPNTYQFVGSCTLTVANPGGLRMLILSSPKEFDVTAPAPRDAGFTVDGHVEPSPGPAPSAVAKVAVDDEVQVELRCPGLNTQCVVTVASE